MLRYLVSRLLQIPAVLLLVSLITFSLMHIAPGDPVEIMLGDFLSYEEDIEGLRAMLGLDKPLYRQYLEWVWGVMHGDLGKSFYTKEDITSMIRERIPYTLALATSAVLLGHAGAILAGIVSAYWHNRWPDYTSMVVSVVGLSVPNFVLAVLLMLLLSIALDLLPISGVGNFKEDPIGSLKYFVIPVISLGASRAALVTRMLRSSMLDVMQEDYVRVARAKGLGERAVLGRHILKNSIIPIITVTAISLAYSLGGSVVTETIFSIPGIGSLMLDAVLWRDFPLIQGITFFICLVFVTANLLADICYALVDPRIHYT